MAQRKGKLSYILESACFNLPNSRMLCFNRQLDKKVQLIHFNFFPAEAQNNGCACQVEEIRRGAASDVCAHGGEAVR